jgi:hypothetical protein
MSKKDLLTVLICGLFMLLQTSLNAQAQKKSLLSIYGDVRFSYTGTNASLDNFDNNLLIMRLRPGVKYTLNSNHSFSARAAYRVSNEMEELDVTAQAIGGGLSLGQMSFDEFYYQYKIDRFLLKAGRFQHRNKVYSNAGRSIDRFQSNNVNVHWSDGMYVKKGLTSLWYSEAIFELIEEGQLAYPYDPPLTFGGNEITPGLYLGLSNDERDALNFIQKSFGIQYFYNAYFDGFNNNGNEEYTEYLAFTSRGVTDYDGGELLKGGSWRFAGEIGYNIQGPVDEGTIFNASVGVNSFAKKHNLMIEFTKVGDEWISANVYGPNTDEMEIRYIFKYNSKIKIESRLRVRDFRNDGTAYSTFIRGTYKF